MAEAADIKNRVPITIALMMATVMNSLDTTIANVALPHIQGSISASPDQITWVLTSYLIATAIMTPLSGWLSIRIGRKLLFMISIIGFTASSMLCGIANSLSEIVVFRLLQGLFGASLIPLSQATVLDLYPPHQVGQVMALWGAAAILGPIFGPALGGWLTDNLSWRWVFYINLPIGILAVAGGLRVHAAWRRIEVAAVRLHRLRRPDGADLGVPAGARSGTEPGLVFLLGNLGRDHRRHHRQLDLLGSDADAPHAPSSTAPWRWTATS